MSIDGFVNKEKLRAFFADCVTPPGMLIEDLPVRYASVATEVSTGREYWLKKGPLEEAIWSSISLPGLFPPVFYHDRWLFDGGLVNPVPISVCRALGADIVLAVNLNGELIGRHSAKKKPKENKEGEGDFVERIAMTIRQYGTTLFGENESPAERLRHHRQCRGHRAGQDHPEPHGRRSSGHFSDAEARPCRAAGILQGRRGHQRRESVRQQGAPGA
jgi:NTE family protein